MTYKALLTFLWTDQAAGWAQAIGTVLAIAATAWIAGRQSREHAADRRREIDIFTLLAADVSKEICRSVRHSRAQRDFEGAEERLNSLRVVLDDIPKAHMPSPEVAVAIIRLERFLGEFWISYNQPNTSSETLDKWELAIAEEAMIIQRAALKYK